MVPGYASSTGGPRLHTTYITQGPVLQKPFKEGRTTLREVSRVEGLKGLRVG